MVYFFGAENLQIDAGDPIGIMNKFKIGGEIAIVDLDAAISGGSKNNVAVIEQLLKVGRCRVGGGIRDVDTAKSWLNKGAHKVLWLISFFEQCNWLCSLL